MSKIKLSYVITTFNKLPYLKQVLRLLLQNVQHDEEIVIADGGSTDGTKEFLLDLFNRGLIHQFVSEKDKGEAHGYNKTFLMARGDLIKVITDDDVFFYPAIRECREFMEKNIKVDIMTGMAAMTYSGIKSPILPIAEFLEEFKKWQANKVDRFYSNGLALMIRKSSIPLMGLFSNEFVYVDVEYSLRASKFANVAFCTQCFAVRVLNPLSKAAVFKTGIDEMYKLFDLYGYPVPKTWQPEKLPDISNFLRLRICLSRLKRRLLGMPPFESKKIELPISSINESCFEDFYKFYEVELSNYNKQIPLSIQTKNI